MKYSYFLCSAADKFNVYLLVCDYSNIDNSNSKSNVTEILNLNEYIKSNNNDAGKENPNEEADLQKNDIINDIDFLVFLPQISNENETNQEHKTILLQCYNYTKEIYQYLMVRVSCKFDGINKYAVEQVIVFYSSKSFSRYL